MFTPFATQQAGIIQDSLVTYFDFGISESYPMTGSIVRDLSAQIANGTIVAGSTFSSSDGSYLDFNGTNTRITPVGTSTEGPSGTFFNQSSFTIQAWVWWDVTTGSPVLCSQGQGTNNQGLHIQLSAAPNRLQFNMYNNDLTAATTIVTNRWYNVAFTYNRATGFRKTIYLNGNVDASANGNQYTSPTSNNNLNIGRVSWTAGSPFTGGYLNGRIAQFLIYGRVLTQQDVVQNYNASKNRFGIY
jgi:hypothetical protein